MYIHHMLTSNKQRISVSTCDLFSLTDYPRRFVLETMSRMGHARTPKSIWPPQACRSLGSRASGNSWAVDSREAGSLPSCPGFGNTHGWSAGTWTIGWPAGRWEGTARFFAGWIAIGRNAFGIAVWRSARITVGWLTNCGAVRHIAPGKVGAIGVLQAFREI